MSAKHRAGSGWSTISAQQRKRMQPAIDAGVAVCWRCKRLIVPGSSWDVGHVEDAQGNWLGTFGPEHRRCNRSAGGKRGAAMTNRRRIVQQQQDNRLPGW